LSRKNRLTGAIFAYQFHWSLSFFFLFIQVTDGRRIFVWCRSNFWSCEYRKTFSMKNQTNLLSILRKINVGIEEKKINNCFPIRIEFNDKKKIKIKVLRADPSILVSALALWHKYVQVKYYPRLRMLQDRIGNRSTS